MSITFPDDTPDDQRLAYILCWFCREVSRMAHAMDNLHREQVAKELRALKNQIVFATMVDLFNYGLLRVDVESPYLLATSWYNEKDCGVHIPQNRLDDRRLFIYTDSWIEVNLVGNIIKKKVAPDHIGETFSLDAWRQLRYLSWFCQAYCLIPSRCQCKSSKELLQGIGALAVILADSGCKIWKQRRQIGIGTKVYPCCDEALHYAFLTLPPDQESKCSEFLLAAPIKKEHPTSFHQTAEDPASVNGSE